MSERLVRHFLRAAPVADVMAVLARLCELDRYQASLGIERAAELVADRARQIGLIDVTIERFPADGAARWWSFRAPQSWTPVAARLEVRSVDGRAYEIDHARRPFSIATYSAPTPRGGLVARLVGFRAGDGQQNPANTPSTPRLHGAVVLVGREEFGAQTPAVLSAAGAAGFVTDAPSVIAPLDATEHAGRIELDPGGHLFAFSVTSSELEELRALARVGAQVRVVIEIDRQAGMPVVTAALPGPADGEEIWLTSHLCHPRPGANDNASGAAALLGVAASLMTQPPLERRRPIRFVWGPEFLGTAAVLHGRTSRMGPAALPSAVVNLDMVGEDQALCGSPLVVEHPPDSLPTLVGVIADHIVGEVFAQTGEDVGAWRSVPFAGFSDHALFADPSVQRPAIQICHTPDRFNHSAADTIDKVSLIEIRRATAASATVACVLAADNAFSRRGLARVVRDWCANERAQAAQVARGAPQHDDRFWGRRFLRHVERRHERLISLAESADAPAARGTPWRQPSTLERATIARRWAGPFNGRAMLAELPASARSVLSHMLRVDKHNLAVLNNFAVRADGLRTRDEIVDETSFALGRPIADSTARVLLDAFLESGWAEERPSSTGAEGVTGELRDR